MDTMDHVYKALATMVVVGALCLSTLAVVRDNNATKVKIAELQQTELVAGKCVKVK